MPRVQGQDDFTVLEDERSTQPWKQSPNTINITQHPQELRKEITFIDFFTLYHAKLQNYKHQK